MKKIKIGVVPYVNAKPLIYGLENNKNVVELCFAVPALLPEMLRRGEVDVALVPSIEYFRDGNLLIIPNIAIASNGEVKSLKLLVRNHHLSLRGAERRSNLMKVVWER
ncbi:MAG TPA: MqnA/MqnD/SBP family protein [Candidatus Brocadiia bacterium]|nr:MqnA/MqnD/SBP family protein [Candidatus Brocadiales bacterium]